MGFKFERKIVGLRLAAAMTVLGLGLSLRPVGFKLMAKGLRANSFFPAFF